MSKKRTKVHPIQTASPNNATAKSPAPPQDGSKRLKIVRDISIPELVLAILLLTAAVVLAFGLFTEYQYDYTETVYPTKSTSGLCAEALEGIDESEIPIEAIPQTPLFYDFTLSVPQSPDVGTDHFKNTVFIGDSRIKGLLMYTDLSPFDFSGEGANVSSVQTKSYIRMKDADGQFKNYTLFDALRLKRGQYGSVYISLGLNELGWKLENFTTSFRTLVRSVREITDAPIYVQLVMPITTRAAAKSQFGITNEKAILFNEALTELTAELRLFRLDPLSLFIMEDGTLDPKYASDGIHLYPESYQTLAMYYRTHVVDTEKYANTRSVDPIEAPPTVVVSIKTASPAA